MNRRMRTRMSGGVRGGAVDLLPLLDCDRNRSAEPSPLAQDAELRKKFWEVSAALPAL
jgi:hypothetical protein